MRLGFGPLFLGTSPILPHSGLVQRNGRFFERLTWPHSSQSHAAICISLNMLGGV